MGFIGLLLYNFTQLFPRQSASFRFFEEGIKSLLEKIFALLLTFTLRVFDNDQSNATSGNEDPFVLEQSVRTDNGIRIDGKLPGKIADGRNHFIGAHRSGGNRKLDLHGDLLKERLRLAGINFY